MLCVFTNFVLQDQAISKYFPPQPELPSVDIPVARVEETEESAESDPDADIASVLADIEAEAPEPVGASPRRELTPEVPQAPVETAAPSVPRKRSRPSALGFGPTRPTKKMASTPKIQPTPVAPAESSSPRETVRPDHSEDPGSAEVPSSLPGSPVVEKVVRAEVTADPEVEPASPIQASGREDDSATAADAANRVEKIPSSSPNLPTDEVSLPSLVAPESLVDSRSRSEAGSSSSFFIIGCATSAPDGSSPRVYVRLEESVIDSETY